MAWFKRNKQVKSSPGKAHDNGVEVVVHQNATKEIVEEAKTVNKQLNKLLLDNGFTLKIYLAAGGKIKRRVAHNGH